MSKTLHDLKNSADSLLEDGEFYSALKIYRLVLEAVPLDFNLRFEIADILRTAEDKRASAIYHAIAVHDMKTGDPLRALAAIKVLETMGIQVEPLLEQLSQTYCAGSSSLGRGVRPAPIDYNVTVRDDIDTDYEMENEAVASGLAQMAAYTDNIENYPPLVPPLPIFSTLSQSAFKKLSALLTLKRYGDTDRIIEEGETGSALYFVARGEVSVFKRVKGDSEASEIRLARLGPGSLFGEMALISSDPRAASVVCDGAVDVFELNKHLVDQLAAEMPNVAGAMARFTRERLISNLLATNPVFQPFDEESKKQLLARFVGHEVPEKTIFIEQGKVGAGLYLILQGSAEVLKWDEEQYVSVAELGPGDVAGEISLIHEEPATATVRTTTGATLLFLARELFYPLIEAVPDFLAHFARLAKQRIEDTEFKLMRNKVVDGDWIESVEDCDDLSDDDLILI